MNTKTFNENYEINRKARGVKATAKNARAQTDPVPVLTADGADYDANRAYHFFDASTQQIRQSVGLRRDGTDLCTFGLKVVAIAEIRADRDDALADGQAFFQSETERMQKRIADYELEKSGKSLTPAVGNRDAPIKYPEKENADEKRAEEIN